MNKKFKSYIVFFAVALILTSTLSAGSFAFAQFPNAQPAQNRVSPNRVIMEEPVGVNDTARVSVAGKGWISILVVMLILSVGGAYYLYKEEQKRKNDYQ